MTTPTVLLLDVLRNAGVEDTDFLCEALEGVLQQLMKPGDQSNRGLRSFAKVPIKVGRAWSSVRRLW